MNEQIEEAMKTEHMNDSTLLIVNTTVRLASHVRCCEEGKNPI